ncbi:hypothetical protein C900_00540 [Fulvivirga imtechensis AK7]|uniref:Co-chaperone DjlA N-terminal domain-containing protein n=1 Tax=Fulvivirga imtechensis AK7 TaxID=1237149 RepID=L8JJA8_9BACT|nr:TerB family tellurite resistance protein [Fulvivirga imtechensis]ELR68313.1 hypothetical protein C900_00540 [Fulvivirga imtechensis AK7]
MGLLDIFSSGSEERKSHIKNLISVAMADGHLAEEEWALLTRVAQRLRMSSEEIQNIKNNPADIQFVVPKKYKEKIQQVNDLVALMMVDGDIDQSELELCKKIALKLDLLPRVVNDLVNKAYYRFNDN